ncbi:Probable urocanate hydratase [Aduncisulcus paluster]|uniref:Probable urocanate hydratase n=1 Tax=Aduncisulcus paluster TaxID=2918883 RepID=A0ABQ5KQ19_9EUKA|nr:Probable urocanate hydratase [Aduncisulcus paluster]
MKSTLACLANGIPLSPLPPPRGPTPGIAHAPKRVSGLTLEQERLAIANALRYIPKELHKILVKDCVQELRDYGHIYFYRFMPTFRMKAYPISDYPAKIVEARSIQLMIFNNLDPEVAQFPEELVTYGSNGSVFQNWAQFWLVMQYLSIMTEKQTLELYSGHPHGLFPSSPDAPRMILTNGLIIPRFDGQEMYEKLYALGCTQYGQMTAGSFCYIGPSGIVHGTTLTVLNAARKFLKSDMSGRIFLSSGLGGMSGAQPKATVITGGIAVIAEVSEEALMKRHKQGWLNEVFRDIPSLFERAQVAKEKKEKVSLGYLGNVVDLWEYLARDDVPAIVDISSDQTSCHNVYGGGYYPVGLSYEESNDLMSKDPSEFKKCVDASLIRQVAAINKVVSAKKVSVFFDYGNSFLASAAHAGAEVFSDEPGSKELLKFRYRSYVELIMGDIFSLGFGPFRWVCTSGKEEDLLLTDRIARDVIIECMEEEGCPEETKAQYADNKLWIEQAHENKLVVGSQARILYADALARIRMAQAFNKHVMEGKLSAPVVLSRDHHDVSGTDSVFRETSNITDGSKFCADMATHNFIGDGIRGATWVALHNGGGCGVSKVINGGHGHVLDGSVRAGEKAAAMLLWDVNNGVTRRAWARNPNALLSIKRAMKLFPELKVTVPELADEEMIKEEMEKKE